MAGAGSLKPAVTPRILVIRGGAIGDFVLTLPAIALLRDAFPAARIEIVGYRHIVALAEGRGYAAASRSIEYGPMAGFFAKNGTLDAELAAYFAGFQQVVSWLYDPDGVFADNMRRAGVRNFLHASPLVGDHDHAARQLARPLERLALYLDDPAARLHPSEEDFHGADETLRALGVEGPFLLAHPGSGSLKKCWPADSWAEMLREAAGWFRSGVVILAGESDAAQVARLREALAGARGIAFAPAVSLPVAAALAARAAAFAGHDSGVSHIAAAAGARCLLLFGPTDPDVWAPRNEGVRVLRAPGGNLADLGVGEVCAAAMKLAGE